MIFNLMAFAKAQEVKEVPTTEKYLGMTTAHLEYVNPTKEELNKMGINTDKEPVYTSEIDVVDVNGKQSKGVQNALSFWYSFEHEGEKKYVSYKIWLSNSAYIGSQSGKIQICDKYGRFAWATPEEYNGNAIPQYSTGPAKISRDYRAAIRGEEEVITLMKAHLGMNITSERQTDGTWREYTDEELAARKDEFECYFEPKDLIEICKGNVKTIRLALAGCNDVKLIFGIRHSDKGDYQIVYEVKKLNFNNLAGLEAEWNKRPMQNVDILFEGHIPANLVKWDVKPTDFNSRREDIKKPEDKDSDLPF